MSAFHVKLNGQGKLVRTAIWKRSVSHRVFARRLNLDDDGQGDLQGHGGEQRAVMVYQLDAYRYWEHELGRNDFEYGRELETRIRTSCRTSHRKSNARRTRPLVVFY